MSDTPLDPRIIRGQQFRRSGDNMVTIALLMTVGALVAFFATGGLTFLFSLATWMAHLGANVPHAQAINWHRLLTGLYWSAPELVVIALCIMQLRRYERVASEDMSLYEVYAKEQAQTSPHS